MNQSENDSSEQFEEFLREHGPSIPQPSLTELGRARLLALIAETEIPVAINSRRRPHDRMKWLATGGMSLAAMLGLAFILVWVNLGRTNVQLATSQWQTNEVLHLLVSARRTQPVIPVPEHIEGISSSDLVLITFHHDLCPLARPCTPKFKDMEQRHRGEAARFMAIDVTGSRRALAEHDIEVNDLRFALLGPPGAETGVVKVLDVTHQRVLCSAPGNLGLEQAERLLAMVAIADRQP